jgi:hypothetical protein
MTLVSALLLRRPEWIGCILLVAGLLLAWLKLGPSAKIRLALMILSAGVGLYILEAAFWYRARNGRDAYLQEAARKSGNPVDYRTKLQVVLELRGRGIDAYPSPISPWGNKTGARITGLYVDGAEIVPLGGVAHKTTVLCNETGQYVTYRSDEHGFHNPEGCWRPGSVCVAAVGDSFTQGQCVASARNLVSLIARNCAAVNLGMAGTGPLFILATIKEYAEALKPRAVLWFHFEGNDFTDLRFEKSSAMLMRYLETDLSQGLMGRQSQVDRALMAVIADAGRSARLKDGRETSPEMPGIAMLPRVRETVNRAIGHTMIMPDEADLDLFRRIIQKAKTIVESWGGRLFFVYLPAPERYFVKPLLGRSRSETIRRRVFAAVASAGITAVNIHEAFLKQKDPRTMFFYPGSHFSEEGYRVVAEAVLQGTGLGSPDFCGNSREILGH